MKVPVEAVKAVLRRRRREAGETRPAKRSRRETRDSPAPAPKGPTETAEERRAETSELAGANVEGAAPVGEQRRSAPAREEGGEGSPSAVKEREGTEDPHPAGGSPVLLVDSPAVDEGSADGVTARGDPAAQGEQGTETPASLPRERETGPADRAGVGETEGRGVEVDPNSPLGPPLSRTTVRKVRGRLPRPARALRGMDDAARAERSLAGAWDPRYKEELRGLNIDGLLDVSLVSLLKAVSGTYALRAAVAGADDSLAQALERVKKYKGRCGEVAEKYSRKLEEAKNRENELGGRLIEAELDRDTWQHRCAEAESKSAVTLSQLAAAEGKIATLVGTLERAMAGSEDLTRRLDEAVDRADATAYDAYLAGRRAEDAEARAREAENEAAAAREKAKAAEADAATANEKARDAEARAAAAEAEGRDEVTIKNYLSSVEFGIEMAEAATDSYLKGFAACKEKVAKAYKLEGLDAIQPSDDDEESEDEDDGGSGQADP